MKHDEHIKFITCIKTQICQNVDPDITTEDINLIVGELENAGMTVKFHEPKHIPNMLFLDVHYKKPHEFRDDDGNRFCVGVYTRTMDPAKISDKIMNVTITKTYQRSKASAELNPNEEWRTHYGIDFHCVGHAWLYGRKKPICGYAPKGLGSIYDYADSIEELRPAIVKKISTIKRYIDGGKPVTK